MKKLIFSLLFLLGALHSMAQAPSDSIGIYAVKDSVLTKMQIISYKSTKISAGFASAKAKLEFDGTQASTQFSGKAVFRVYFGTPAATQLRSQYMFSSSYSIADFIVGSFAVKKGSRFLTTTAVSLVGGRVGAKEAKDLVVETKQLRDKVYEITISGAPGEYCIMHSVNGSGGYGGVFDFSIK
jgi:hypothetical protein